MLIETIQSYFADQWGYDWPKFIVLGVASLIGMGIVSMSRR